MCGRTWTWLEALKGRRRSRRWSPRRSKLIPNLLVTGRSTLLSYIFHETRDDHVRGKFSRDKSYIECKRDFLWSSYSERARDIYLLGRPSANLYPQSISKLSLCASLEGLSLLWCFVLFPPTLSGAIAEKEVLLDIRLQRWKCDKYG